MKKKLLNFCIPLALGLGFTANAQRYCSEIFSDSQIQVTSDVTFDNNVDFLRSDFSDQIAVVTDITAIKTALAMGNPIPLKYFLTNDANTPVGDSTSVKVTPVKMDIYEPMQSIDNVTDRPVIVYVHTGNFIPPPFNGQPTGRKEDWTAVELCKQWAKRGFVVVSVAYRGGWNPVSPDAAVRRGTLLNAVYRAIHDVKQGVRFLKNDAEASNTYAIDKDNVILYGQGSGGYVALGYATLDKNSELEIPKFLDPSTTPSSSYINRTFVGEIDGTGGIVNLYTNPNNQNSDIVMMVNAGGALADSSWLEAGDVPMVDIQCVRDQFAPFTHGWVIVTTTGEQVVEVQGPNIWMKKANALGNNAPFYNNTWTDPYTTAAKSRYGQTYSYWSPVDPTITVENDLEGCFPVVLPLVTAAQAPLQNQASPWEWWDPTHPLATAIVSAGPPTVTAHQANLLSNPDMSETKGKTYLDTIQGYMMPRVCEVLKANGVNIGVEENQTLSSFLTVYPNPTNDFLSLDKVNEINIDKIEVIDLSGRVVMTSFSNENRTTIDLTSLNSGIYILKVESDNGTLTQKIVKQ
jgi:hypothetical protein